MLFRSVPISIPVMIVRAMRYIGHAELFSETRLYTLHCSAMIVSFQMHTTVDKEIRQEFRERAVVVSGFFTSFTQRNKNLTFCFGKREGEDVGRFIFVAVNEIELLDMSWRREVQAQFILRTEDDSANLEESSPRRQRFT